MICSRTSPIMRLRKIELAQMIERMQFSKALSYVYFPQDGERAGKLLSKDEARRIAANIAKLPVEMRTPDQYRDFAAHCYRVAAEAKTEEHQKIMEEMARVWKEVVEEAERREG
jgi:hypothetical protein